MTTAQLTAGFESSSGFRDALAKFSSKSARVSPLAASRDQIVGITRIREAASGSHLAMKQLLRRRRVAHRGLDDHATGPDARDRG